MQPNQRGQHNPLGARGVLQGAWAGLSGGAGQPVQELSFGSLLQSSRSAAPVRYLPPPTGDTRKWAGAPPTVYRERPGLLLAGAPCASGVGGTPWEGARTH